MEIIFTELKSKKAIAIRDNCIPSELPAKYKEIYDELSGVMKNQNLEFSHAPFGIYHSFSEDNVNLEAGIPVTGEPKPEGRSIVMNTYGGKTLCGKFYGHYSNLKNGWNELMEYIRTNNIEITGPCFEVYITEPESEADTSKWLTEIHCPVK